MNFYPFHPVYGLGKAKEELEQKGILIENIPEPKYIENKQAIMYWNPADKQIFYEYEDIPKNKDDLLQERLSALEKSNAEMMNLIATIATPTE
ncbi:hypothetical protein EXQ27_04115 [Clostridium botulinum]|nr:hypothetical protein [Clostridium botulinum]MBO0578906.1 hypothetical protein [Clostridium botulinum]